MPRDTGDEPPSSGLRYVNCDDPGLVRVRRGRDFGYLRPDGEAVKDVDDLARISALAIPPAWSDVWICPDPRGHIQATGRDARGRKQYRYHPDWKSVRDEAKFHRIADFGRALPRLRRRVDADLRKHGLPREKVLAAVTRLLETTLIRVGNDIYAKTNRSFGLTTLRKRHAQLSSVGGEFQFRGKSGKHHTTRFRDARLARVVRTCQDLPGQRLFQYLDEDGQRRSIDSSDVNDYIRAALGEDFSAKDFRTWFATVAAAKALALQPPPASEAEARRIVTLCVKSVSGLLGNTPTVCRAAYIHPRVIDLFASGGLRLRPSLKGRPLETAVIRLLSEDGPGVEASRR